MSKKSVFVTILIVFVILIAGAFFLYRSLSGRYTAGANGAVSATAAGSSEQAQAGTDRTADAGAETDESAASAKDAAAQNDAGAETDESAASAKDAAAQNEAGESGTDESAASAKDAAAQSEAEISEADENTASSQDASAQNEAGESAEQETIVAPDFQMTDIEGNTYALSDFAGKPVIANFWATWCKYCVIELPEFEEAYKEYGDRINFLIVDLPSVQETLDMVTAFIGKNGYTFPVYLDKDSSAASTYGIYSIPLTLVIDAEGNLVKYHMGAMDGNTLKQYIDLLLG